MLDRLHLVVTSVAFTKVLCQPQGLFGIPDDKYWSLSEAFSELCQLLYVYPMKWYLCRLHLGIDLTRSDSGDEGLFKAFWHHSDAIMCCAWKVYFLLLLISCCQVRQLRCWNTVVIKMISWVTYHKGLIRFTDMPFFLSFLLCLWRFNLQFTVLIL